MNSVDSQDELLIGLFDRRVSLKRPRVAAGASQADRSAVYRGLLD
jgi:hypothetical protein